MDITLRESAEVLGMRERDVLRLVRDRKIRAYKMNGVYRLNRDELNEWILSGRVEVGPDALARVRTTIPVNMYRIIERGGIHYRVAGKSIAEVLANAVDRIPLPNDVDRASVVSSLLEREEIMTTGVGSGIALPHPRNPIMADAEYECVSICFLEDEVDFSAIDDKPVSTLVVILSANQRRHIEILSKVSNLCRDNSFMELLSNRALPEEIMREVEFIEREWRIGR